MINKSSTRIALGGISASLCLVVMLTTALLPFATYALPALSGIMLIPLALELGAKTAWVCYTSVSILSLLIVPDREAALMFIAFFGYYPILKIKLDRIKYRFWRRLLKVFIFDAAMVIAYTAVIYIFGMTYLIEEFSNCFGWMLLAVATLFFPVYELALHNMYRIYIYRIRKFLFKDKR